MKRQTEPTPEPPPRQLDKELAAMNQILNALAPFDKETQTRLVVTVAQFLNVYIPRGDH